MIKQDNSNPQIKILNKEGQEKDYPKDVFKVLFDIESKHFWFWGRNKIITSFIEKAIKEPSEINFLEVGCGTGYVLAYLEKLGLKLTGLDMHLEGLNFAKTRVSCPLWCGDLNNIKSHKKFDGIGLFDVLEHIEDEDMLLKKVRSFLKVGGLLFITVPANMLLWSDVDRVSGHKRRYSKSQLIRVLGQNGYQVVNISYYGSFLYLPMLVLRRLRVGNTNDKINTKMTLLEGGLDPPPRSINLLFKGLFLIEEWLLRIVNLPLGASLIVTAKKI